MVRDRGRAFVETCVVVGMRRCCADSFLFFSRDLLCLNNRRDWRAFCCGDFFFFGIPERGRGGQLREARRLFIAVCAYR